MRKITEQSIQSFNNNENFKQGNTRVDASETSVYLILHKTKIAIRTPNNDLYIDTGGYLTRTTKERLNGLENVNIVQRDGVWYLNGNEWNGEKIKVK